MLESTSFSLLIFFSNSQEPGSSTGSILAPYNSAALKFFPPLYSPSSAPALASFPASSSSSTSAAPILQAAPTQSLFPSLPGLTHLERRFLDLHLSHLPLDLASLGEDLLLHLSCGAGARARALSVPEYRRLPHARREAALARNGRAAAQLALCRYLVEAEDGGAAQIARYG